MVETIACLIHIPLILLGRVVGTIWVGLKSGFFDAVDFWEEK